MSGEQRESGGESGNAGESEGTSRDAEWTDEDLRNSLPGLATTHHDAW
jgi:hypothetical protein